MDMPLVFIFFLWERERLFFVGHAHSPPPVGTCQLLSHLEASAYFKYHGPFKPTLHGDNL